MNNAHKPRTTKPRAAKPRTAEVVGYVRVSTTEQAEGGASLGAQEAAVRAYCSMRGLTLAAVVVDAGISGGVPLAERPGGAEVVDLVSRGAVAGVVAVKLDRLFRDAADCLTMTRAWDARGVALHLVDMGGQTVDTSSAMGRFFVSMMAAVAEMERGLIGERTRATMAHLRGAGRRVGAIPYGQRLAADGVHLEADEAEQAVIAAVRDLRGAGLSWRAVAAELGRAGMHPRAGGAWFPAQVARMVAP